jgi:hypothetical protein
MFNTGSRYLAVMGLVSQVSEGWELTAAHMEGLQMSQSSLGD